MIHTSTKLSPIAAINDHCGTGACMNILNYFWGTTFSLKDTLDVETMIRFGHFDWNERPAETEILYFLAQLGFKIELYSQDVGDWELSIWDIVWHEKKHGYTPHPLVNKERWHVAGKKLSQHQNFNLIEDIALDIPSIIRKKSDGKHMFLFGLDSVSIYNNPQIDNKILGHIMASLWYISRESEYIWLLETSPAAEMIERTYDQIYTAQKVFSPDYTGPKGEIMIISLI